MSDMSRRSFEASTPSGYTRVTLTDLGRVWGTPDRFTTDSSLGAVAYMLLGSVRGCSFANEELGTREHRAVCRVARRRRLQSAPQADTRVRTLRS